MNNKLTQCISIKNVVWKSPRLLSCVEIKKKMFLLSNSNKGLLFEQSCVTQLVNDIMSFLCWVYVFSLLKEYRQRPHSDVLPTTATMYTHQLMITQSSLDIHSVYIPQSYPERSISDRYYPWHVRGEPKSDVQSSKSSVI